MIKNCVKKMVAYCYGVVSCDPKKPLNNVFGDKRSQTTALGSQIQLPIVNGANADSACSVSLYMHVF